MQKCWQGARYAAVVQPALIQCSAVQCIAVQYSTVQCSVVQCSEAQHSALQCSAVQSRAVQRSALQCGKVYCSTNCNVVQGLIYFTRHCVTCTVQCRVVLYIAVNYSNS